MKAIVIAPSDSAPRFVEDFPEPQVNGDDQIKINVLAVAMKQLDRSNASGHHYAAQASADAQRVVGVDGVGSLADGTRVFALGITGMMAEKAIVDKNNTVMLPKDIDLPVAAALPNAVAGSAMALRFRANIKPGDTVLINGATGVTGSCAVQIAKYYGAGRIIATGRNKQALAALLNSGADETIQLNNDPTSLGQRLTEIHRATPIDIVVDYLWGSSAEVILTTLKGNGAFTHRTRYVSIGSMQGDKIQLSSEILRSADIHLTGSGMGSWTRTEVKVLITEILPEMFKLAIDGKLYIETQTIPMQEIGNVWDIKIESGKRLVVLIPE